MLPYNPKLKQLARQLRNNSTQSEIKLWMHLKGQQMMGFDFHRQKPIDNFILDFFCNELMLGIELDGLTHSFEEVNNNDNRKEEVMQEFGINILRFTDHMVMNDISNVLLAIEVFIEQKMRTDLT